MLAGNRCSAGFWQNTATSSSESIAAILSASSSPPNRSFKKRGALERPLHRDLLIEEHADEQRERIGVEQAVGVGVAGDREGSLHDQSLRLHHGSSCLVSVSG